MIEPRTSSIGTAGKTIFSAVVKLPEENKTKTIDITDDVKEIQEFVSSIPNGTPGGAPEFTKRPFTDQVVSFNPYEGFTGA